MNQQITEKVTSFMYRDKKITLIAIAAFLFFCGYYSYLLACSIGTDVQEHAFVSYKFVNAGGAVTPNFLYFILVAIFAGFSKYKITYYAASVLLISGALALKFIFNYRYATTIPSIKIKQPGLRILMALSLLFVFCLPGIDFFREKNFFLGQLAPNIWHNSTTIFLFPFAIPLFFETFLLMNDVDSGYKNRKVLILVLLILNALIKPSFLFILLPAVFIWLLFFNTTYSLPAKVRLILLYATGLIAVVLQYIIIYNRTNVDCVNCASSVVLEPFKVWNHYSASKVISFITSFFFPIVFIIISKGQIVKDALVKFTLINWFFGMLIYILFVETGEREFHGNFSWQMVIGNYLLFYVMAARLFAERGQFPVSSMKYKLLCFLFGAHVVWGVGYFLKIALFKHYA